MAWNPSPKIADLRNIAPKWGYDQMIVLAINSKTGTFETVSYGVTRQLCDEARKINEQIHAKVASGDIEIDA
jgi:hypothetical protein